MVYIGIDTGVNTGVAVWDAKQQSLILVKTMKIHQAMEIVRGWASMEKTGGDKIFVRVEDPRQRKWFQTMDREKERHKLQNVGSVKRDASVWDDFLKDLGVSYEMVAPKNNVTKLSAVAFKSLTGWEHQTNEHNRDASMLVFGYQE